MHIKFIWIWWHERSIDIQKSIIKGIFLCTVILLSLVGDWIYFLNTPLIRQSQIIIFEKGQPVSNFIAQLSSQHIISAYQAFHLKLWFKFSDIDMKLKAGEYAVNQDARPVDFLDILIKGDSIVHKITLIEGWTFSEMKAAIADNAILKRSESLDDAKLMDKLGFPNQMPEGHFFPDTYYFVRGMTDEDILLRAKQKMDALLQDLWSRQAPSSVLASPYEGLILASLIEKESAVPAEYPLISGVFHQRLKKKMRLQCDPTIIYGLGAAYTGKLHTKDLQLDTPYNTYLHTGLPPTPIAAPSRKALEAAFFPAETEALYFVAKGDGSHTFSTTLADHNVAVEKMKQGKQHE